MIPAGILADWCASLSNMYSWRPKVVLGFAETALSVSRSLQNMASVRIHEVLGSSSTQVLGSSSTWRMLHAEHVTG